MIRMASLQLSQHPTVVAFLAVIAFLCICSIVLVIFAFRHQRKYMTAQLPTLGVDEGEAEEEESVFNLEEEPEEEPAVSPLPGLTPTPPPLVLEEGREENPLPSLGDFGRSHSS